MSLKLHHLHSWSQHQGERTFPTCTPNKSPEFTQTRQKWIDFSPSKMWFCPNPIEARRSCLCVHSKNMWRTGECGRRSFVSDSAVIFNSSPMCSSNQNRMFLIKWTRKYLFMQLTLMWQMKRSVTQRFHHDGVEIKKRGQVYLYLMGDGWGVSSFWYEGYGFMTLSFLFSQTGFSAFSANRCDH